MTGCIARWEQSEGDIQAKTQLEDTQLARSPSQPDRSVRVQETRLEVWVQTHTEQGIVSRSRWH